MNKVDFNFINPGADWCSACGNPRVGCTCDDYTDPTPVVLPWWINDALLTMTDGEKCIDNVRENSALYRVMIANGWKVVTR